MRIIARAARAPAPPATGRRRATRTRRAARTVRIGLSAGLLLGLIAVVAPSASADICGPVGDTSCTPAPIPAPPTPNPPPPGLDSDHFLAYERAPSGSWTETDLTALNGETVVGPITPISTEYDSVSGNIEAYAEGNDGHLIEFWQVPGASGWGSGDITDAAGGVTINGDPDAIATSTGVDVFALSSSRLQILEFAWTPAAGWKESVVGSTSLNTNLEVSGFMSDPRAVWDGHNVHVYISEITGTETIPQITEFFSANGGPWQRFTLATAMDNPSPALVGSTINVAGRQDVPCSCGGFTYGTSGDLLDLTEPASSPGSDVTVTNLTATVGITPLPASLSYYPAVVDYGEPQFFTEQSTARNSAGGDIPLLEEYYQNGSGQWTPLTISGLGGGTPIGEDGLGSPALAVDSSSHLNVLIDNAGAPDNGADETGSGDLQLYQWNGSSWQFTDVTQATASPPITAYPAAAATPQGYLYAFAAQS
jgi:hypothetical protein